MMWSNGSGGWLLALPLVIICMVMMMRMGHSAHGSRTSQSQAHGAGGPERILAERLARGEIDTEEYERRLAALRSTSERERT